MLGLYWAIVLASDQLGKRRLGRLSMEGWGIMRFLFGIMAGLAAASGAASAQQASSISNPRVSIENFDIANLKPLLTELGLTTETRQSPDGQSYIAANYGGQFTFNLIPTACLNAGVSNCVGLNILALFSGGQVNAQTVSAFNQRYSFTSAGALSNKSGAYISRYEIADYGIPRGNVASSVGNFLVLLGRFRNEIETGAQTISQDGYADDMSARFLNGRSLSEATGAPQMIASRLELHQAGFEQAPELVKMLMSDDNAPRNKIRNITPE